MSEASGNSREGAIDEFDARSLDAVVAGLRDHLDQWTSTSARQRADLVARAIHDTHTIAPRWNAQSCRAKGLDPEGPAAGEELLAGIGMFVNALHAYHRTLLDIARTGRPRLPGRLRERAGRRAVQVLPLSLLDRVIYPGNRAEIWMTPGMDDDAIRATQAVTYRERGRRAGVSLVLGAGNVAALGPKDVIHKLIVEGHVVILKANPVNEYLVEFWRRALAVFIDAGFLQIVTGSSRVGEYLVNHAGVDDVHLTGSRETYEAVVFGTGEQGARRKATGTALVNKPFSAELGNVSPVIVVPGNWTARELRYQSQHVATMLVNNAGFNCLTPRVIVTHREWPQRRAFLDAVENTLATLPTRRAYYPGAFARRELFLTSHPDAHHVGSSSDGEMPWTVIRDVNPTDRGDVCFRREAFCALTSETGLTASTPEEFLSRAVEFCNDVLEGTLSMTLLVDSRSLRRPEIRRAVDQAVAQLRYGCIGVNVWHALGILLGAVPWGAYPGHVPTDIGSGVGSVGNAFMFERPEKTVLTGPFVARPTPTWFATHRRSTQTIRHIFEVQCTQSWSHIPAALWSALRP